MRRAVARGRVFPQRFSTDRRYGRLSLKAIGLFPLLWANGDDQGRLCGDPEEVKYTCCPNIDHITKADIPELLSELEQTRLIQVYATPNSPAIQLLDWWEVQRPQWAYPSEYPPPEGWQDRLRYHRTPSDIITENWIAPGHLERRLPNRLPGALPKELPDEPGSGPANNEKGVSGGYPMESGSALPGSLPNALAITEKEAPGNELPNSIGSQLANKPEDVPSPLTTPIPLPPVNISPEIPGKKDRDVEDEEGRLPSELPSELPGALGSGLPSTGIQGEWETGPPESRREAEKMLGESDREVISVWRSVKGFKLSPTDAAALVAGLKTEFPEIDLLAESKRWAARKLSEPLKKDSRPSQQIWNWMEMARKFNRPGREQVEKRQTKRSNGEKQSGPFGQGPWYAGNR